MLFVVKTIFRHIAYCLQNMALVCNIFSFIREKKLFYGVTIATITVSVFLFIVQLSDVMGDDYNFMIYPVQGFLVQGLLFFGYYYVFKK